MNVAFVFFFFGKPVIRSSRHSIKTSSINKSCPIVLWFKLIGPISVFHYRWWRIHLPGESLHPVVHITVCWSCSSHRMSPSWGCRSLAGFLAYALTTLLLVGTLVVFFVPRYGQTNILIYLGICSSMGSLTVSVLWVADTQINCRNMQLLSFPDFVGR